MEGKYVKKNAENQVHQNLQRCVLSEQDLKDQLEVFYNMITPKYVSVTLFVSAAENTMR